MMFESDSSEEDEEIAPSTSLLGESLPYVGTSAGEVAYKSAEFVEAKCSIAKNPYDKNSWKVMLEEAEKSENKSLILDSFCNATTQFPRAASLLRRYVHFLTRYGETKLAEDVFRKCLTKCRSVELWDQYLVFVRSKTIDNHPPTSDHYTNTKKTYETAFENALENVGLSLDVNIIWRKYIDFVLEWPDTKEVDSGRKLTALRELYQRAVSCPMDHLDSFWREYEEWEMKSGKHLAEQLLPEFKRKYQDARNIYKDRKKLYAGIDMLHIAAPPTMEGSIVEMKQLELWNNLIKCEVKTLIDSTEAQRKALINFLFDRFLTCFYFHPEAWIMLSQCQLQFFTSTDARNTLKESILVIPNVPTLWLNLAELEESDGDVESAEDILRLCFEQVPSSFTFSIFQKFIRRKDGKVAARKFFSDTVLLREEGVLGLETYVAHAALELEVNNEPACALRILELARDKYPTAYSSVVFVKVLTKVLVRLGDYRQLRWVYEAKIGLLEDNNSLVKKQSKNSSMFNNADEQSLLEDLLEAEIIMGMCDTKRLLMLQERVSRVKVDSAKVSHSLVSKIDLFEPTQQFFIRYQSAATCLPDEDAALKVRVGGVLTSEMNDNIDQRTEQTVDGKGRRKRRGDDVQEVELSGVPIFLRDLLLALPPHSGYVPNTDEFIDQLRRTVLPPRPVSETNGGHSDTLLGFGSGSLESGNKRKLQSMDDDADLDIDENNNNDSKHDVFRQRRRVKMIPN